MDDDKVVRVVQYQQPPLWWEYLCYLGMLCVFALMAVDTTNIWAGAVITAWAMYWNYHLFRIIREYVKHVNANEFSKLLTIIAQEELNKQEKGTFQDSDCLTKEQDSEANETRSSSEGD